MAKSRVNTSAGRAVWSVVSALAVAASLASLVPARGTFSGDGCCVTGNGTCIDGLNVGEFDCDLLNGTFTNKGECSESTVACVPKPLGCCAVEFGCSDSVTDLQCAELFNSTFVPGGNCTTGCEPPTPTATATATATASATSTSTATGTATATATETATGEATPTATATMIPDGGSCTDPTDCLSGNCVDDVCCESACDGADQQCNLPGLEGNCLALSATVPAASGLGLTAAIAALLAIGVAAMLRRRLPSRG